jgi:integrase
MNMITKASQAEYAKPVGGKQTEYRVEGVRGLVLLVAKSGLATWLFKYSVATDQGRKFRTVNIGRRSDVSLADAKAEAGRLFSLVDHGQDPAQQAKGEAKARAEALTFRELWDERLRLDDRCAASTLKNYRTALELDVFPTLGDLPACEITGTQIAHVLSVVEERSKLTAHKCRSAIGGTYRWALRRRLVNFNPTVGLGYTHRSPPRTRILSSEELSKLWQGIDTAKYVSPAMRCVLKLVVLTGQRIGQVTGASVSELEHMGTATPLWRIPAYRMKRKDREQIVPLSAQAAALFRDALALRYDPKNAYVFPADMARVRVGKKPRTPHIHRESATKAVARVCASIGIEDFCGHDNRKAITTWLAEVKRTPSDVLDMILHHASKGVTGTHYNFATLQGPVREALQSWADHVTVVSSVGGVAGGVRETSRVLELKTKALGN